MSHAQPTKEQTKHTFFWDRIRGAFYGLSEPLSTAFALLIVLEAFPEAPTQAKAIIASAIPIGMLINPLSLGLVSRIACRANIAASGFLIIAAFSILIAASAQNFWFYFAPLIIAMVCSVQIMPMLIHTYAENYPSNKRGSFLSKSMVFTMAISLSFAFLGGKLLDQGAGFFRVILIIVACGYLGAAFAISRLKSSPVQAKESSNPIRNLGYVFSDRPFGLILLANMFMGLGNFIVMALRFEYLKQEEFGIVATASTVALVTAIIPASLRMASAPFWGKLFDHINFLILRMVLNSLFVVYIILFFSTQSLWIIGLAAVFQGLCMGGGNIAWSLWVTKFAPKGKTAAYMSIHTSTTGLRGLIGPMVGYFLWSHLDPQQTSWVSAACMCTSISILMILYFRTRGKLATNPA